MPAQLKETSYAYLERFRFISKRLAPQPGLRVLDIGCGTGQLLSAPLVKQFPQACFCLVENDPPSLAQARTNLQRNTNCEFLPTIPAGSTFDTIIASEVLEHVEQPRAFLRELHRHLGDSGKLLLTVPNGYGPSEALASLEFALKIFRRSFFPKPSLTAGGGEDTLAYSPHIQFFGLSRLKKMLAEEGFEILDIRGRMLVCGFPVSLLIDRIQIAQKLNVFLARILPLRCSSDWMIEAKKVKPASSTVSEEKPGLYVRWKRALSTHPLLRPTKAQIPSVSVLEHFSDTSQSFFSSYRIDDDFKERLTLWSGFAQHYAKNAQSALDLGCGPGVLTGSLLSAGLRVTASDGSAEMLALCQKNNASAGSRLELVQATLPEIKELLGREVDLIFCSSVLEYVDNLPLAISNLAGLVRPGGTAIVSFPNRCSLYRLLERLRFKLTGRPEYVQYVKTMLTRDEMEKKFAEHGLQMMSHQYYGLGSRKQRMLLGILPDVWRKNLIVGVFSKNSGRPAPADI